MSSECQAVDRIVTRNHDKAFNLQQPVNESENLRNQAKHLRKRVNRRHADKYDAELWADKREEVPTPQVNDITENGQGYFCLEDVLSEASKGETRQIMKFINVKAVNGTKIHYQPARLVKAAINEEVENQEQTGGEEEVSVYQKKNYNPRNAHK